MHNKLLLFIVVFDTKVSNIIKWRKTFHSVAELELSSVSVFVNRDKEFIEKYEQLLQMITCVAIAGEKKVNAGCADRIRLLRAFLLYNLAEGEPVAQLCGWSENKQTFSTRAPVAEPDWVGLGSSGIM